MKRPFAVIGFSYLAALRVAFIIGIEYAVILSIVCATAATVTLFVKRIRLGGALPAALYSAAAALIILSAFSQVFVMPAQNYVGKTGTISAELVDLPYKQNDRYYYKMKINSSDIDDANTGTTALISSEFYVPIEPYDSLTATVRFYDNTSGSFQNYNISRGVYVRGSIIKGTDREIIKNDSKPVYYYVLMLKKAILNTIDSLLPEKEASLVKAMLLSDKTGLDEYNKTTFKAAGVSHIIVVSGFHLTIIVTLFSLFLSIFIKNKQIRSLLSCGAVVMFMCLVGFTPSIMRAGIMQIAVLLAAASYKAPDSFNTLGIAALIICFINPYTSADIGFLLSFYATLGIVLCEAPISKYILEHLHISKENEEKKMPKEKKISTTIVIYLVSIISVTVSAVLFTTPVTILYFRSFALYSILFNLLISPAASLLLCVTVIMVIIGLIPYLGVIAVPLAFLCRLLADYIFLVASLSRLLPYSLVSASHDYIPACLLLTIGIVIILFLILKNRRRAVLSGALSAILVFTSCFVFSGIMELGSKKVSVVDTGDGLSVIYQTSGETAVLFCGGDKGSYYDLESYFQASDINIISYLLLTDYSNADTGYARNLLEDTEVNTLHIYDRDRFPARTKQAAENNNNIIDSSYKDDKIVKVSFSDTIINVYRCYDCCAVYFEVSGHSFLVLGDMTDCKLIPEKWRSPDYLIMNGIIDNISLLKPTEIILSDSQENIIEDLNSINSPESDVYCTGGDGTVSVRIYAEGQTRIRRENTWLS